MALGDSLYNGVQSLRINWWLSEWSPPSLIAIRLGLIQERAADRTGRRQFYAPQYPGHGGKPSSVKNYGFNLETRGLHTFIHRTVNLLNVPAAQRTLLTELLTYYRPPNQRAMVDNIAFSGANSIDLVAWTPKDYRRLAKSALSRMSGGIGTSFAALSDAFTYSNATFVLNPMHDRCLETMTPLEQVELRRPKRLLINIGSNNGLYKIGFFGTAPKAQGSCAGEDKVIAMSGQPHCVSPIHKFIEVRLDKDMDELLARLSKVKGLEYVYINGLALPSQVANVVYSPEAEARGMAQLDILAGRDVALNLITSGDDLVRNANRNMAAKIANANRLIGPKFVFVDVAAVLSRYDYKFCMRKGQRACEDKRLIVPGSMSGTRSDHLFDNRPLQASGSSQAMTGEAFLANHKAGGLFSFDNMHLSSLGYEVMAASVTSAMKAANDSALIPLATGVRNRCRAKDNPADPMMPGDCIGQLTQPGWSIADKTRRDFVFQRIAGSREMRNKRFVTALMAFMQ